MNQPWVWHNFPLFPLSCLSNRQYISITDIHGVEEYAPKCNCTKTGFSFARFRLPCAKLCRFFIAMETLRLWPFLKNLNIGSSRKKPCTITCKKSDVRGEFQDSTLKPRHFLPKTQHAKTQEFSFSRNSRKLDPTLAKLYVVSNSNVEYILCSSLCILDVKKRIDRYGTFKASSWGLCVKKGTTALLISFLWLIVISKSTYI